MPLVTIAIPTYDRLEYLKEAVASARAQTYDDIEVLIGDDGSTTPEIKAWAESIANSDSRVRYQRNERNRGLAGNWNALADAARGEFIVIIGDDDRLLPDFVEKLVELAQGANVAFSNHFLIDSEGRRLDWESVEATKHYRRDRLPAGVITEATACVWRNSVPMSSSLIRTRDVQRLRFKEDLNTPEIEFFARLANEGAQFVFTPDYLAEYRSHPASATTNGLRSEALARRLCDIPVPADVEPIKREFMAAVMVDAVSRCLRRGDRGAAHEFLKNSYYPHSSRGLKPAVTYLAQAVCANLPAGIGCGAYRLMQRAKAGINV